MDVLQVNHSYPIEHTRKVFKYFAIKNKFDVRVTTSPFESCGDLPWVKSHLHLLGLNVDRVHGYYFLRMDNYEHMGLLILHVYLVDDGRGKFLAAQIMDICVKQKWRGQGIGSQLMQLILHIANKNSVRYVFGELERKGDLESRKNFFSKNGFRLVENSDFKMSGLCAFKDLSGGDAGN